MATETSRSSSRGPISTTGRLDQQRPGLREPGYPGGGDLRRDDRDRKIGGVGSRGPLAPQQQQQQDASAPSVEPLKEASEKLLNKINGFVNEFVFVKDPKEALQVRAVLRDEM